MRRLVIVPLVAGAALISSILAAPAFSLDNGDVTATITAGALCLTVPSTTLAFPSKPLSTSAVTSISTVVGPAVESCSTLTEDIKAQGTDAEGGGTWVLVTPGDVASANCLSDGGLTANQFALNFDGGATQVLIGKGASKVGTLTANATLPNYELDLYMPCTGSNGVGTEKSFTITFTATAP